MIGAVLNEIAASATASLSAAIDLTATRNSVTLNSTVNVETWESSETSAVRKLPSLQLCWKGTRSGMRKPAAGVRDATHDITLSYAYEDTTANLAVIANQMKYVPEAMLLWLDDFPTASRSAGKTIQKINAPMGQDIAIEPKILTAREGFVMWGVDMALKVEARDTNILDPVASIDDVTPAGFALDSPSTDAGVSLTIGGRSLTLV